MLRFTPYTLNINGRLLTIDRPQVMAIINATDDSFYSRSQCHTTERVASLAREHIENGADIIDIGACSTRPGSKPPSAEEEINRLLPAIKAIRNISDEIPISVDTYRADVASKAIEAGADIINDISSGNLDDRMFAVVAELRVPYILTHMRGTPATMQCLTDYAPDVVTAVIAQLAENLNRLRQLGVADVIVDPGFGFAKTLMQNYRLLSHLADIRRALDAPILVGVSRKSMITRPLGISPDEALCATGAINTMALLQGASILRVHDSRQTAQIIKLSQLYTESE